MINKIICGDNVEVMKKLPDGYVDLTVTSPPYDSLRKYNGYSFDFESVAKELYRITKNGGVVIWVVGDSTINGSESGTSFKQALHFMEVGFRLHDTMIYEKANPVPLTHRRYEQKFEYMFVFSKGRPKTFNPIMRRNKNVGNKSGGTHRVDGQNLSTKNTPGNVKKESIDYNIWSYSVGSQKSTKDKCAFEHPAIFPEKLAGDHILSWSNEGDLVFDPFVGSGTTAKMAVLNNRGYLGVDISEDYCDLATKRIDKAVMRADGSS